MNGTLRRTPTLQQEIETKLQVDSAADLDRVPRWLAEQGGRCSGIRLRRLRDEYLDTSDRRFFSAGVACRIRIGLPRKQRELTLKSLLRPQAGVSVRTELTEPLKGRAGGRYPCRFPGHILARQLKPWLQQQKIGPVFILDQRRRVFDAVLPETGLEIEVSLDETRLAGTEHRLFVVEFELRGGTARDLRALTRAGRRYLNARPATPSKFAWASRLSGIRWPALPAQTTLLTATGIVSPP